VQAQQTLAELQEDDLLVLLLLFEQESFSPLQHIDKKGVKQANGPVSTGFLLLHPHPKTARS
jgi:hypothetical protein